jgi:hypothetical protein
MKKSLIFLQFDLSLQVILLFINTILLIGFYYMWLYLMFFQLLLGSYQFLMSATPHTLLHLKNPSLIPAERSVIQYRFLHYGISVLVLIGFVIGVNGGFDSLIQSSQALHWGLFITGFFVIPQVLAYFYFWITWKHYNVLKQAH